MIVYHGSSVIVAYPDTAHSYPFLDFGKGFYATTFESQATTWAKRKAVCQNEKKEPSPFLFKEHQSAAPKNRPRKADREQDNRDT